MAQKKRDVVDLTTPRFTFVWPKLTTPDYGSKDFPKPDGEYSINWDLDPSDEADAAFLAKLEKVHADAVAEAREQFGAMKVAARKELERKNPADGGLSINPVGKTLYDEETEEPTGIIRVKMSRKAGGTSKKTGKKWTARIDYFDGKGRKITKVPDIWGGTVGKASVEVSKYFIPGTGAVGIKLSISGVQLITLNSGGGKNADGHGFGVEDDGYEHDDDAAKKPSEDDEFEEEDGFKDETDDDGTDADF